VQPLFTEGAYNVGGFYTFYAKYSSTPLGKSINSSISNLTAVIPHQNDLKYYGPLVKHIQKFAPDTIVSIISDEDVNDGYIFRHDGTNAYDILFLLHAEYTTRQEYDNFKRFVGNGGTIVFLDGNVFYAQIYYNRDMHTVTLVKGHGWFFDGKAATKSVQEGYFDQNVEWVGSNFLHTNTTAITFSHNPFNYTHFEENYVNNPNSTILFDYGAQIPDDLIYDKSMAKLKIAAYELNYGKGKVIMMGLYAQKLVRNEAFLEFFDHIVLPRALGQPYKHKVLDVDGNETVSYWWLNTGKVLNVSADDQSNKVNITLERDKQIRDTLLVTLPARMVDDRDSGTREFNISVNEKPVNYEQTTDDIETGFEIPLSANATRVQISMTSQNQSGLSGLLK
jgi:hypothetical protein